MASLGNLTEAEYSPTDLSSAKKTNQHGIKHGVHTCGKRSTKRKHQWFKMPFYPEMAKRKIPFDRKNINYIVSKYREQTNYKINIIIGPYFNKHK